MEFKTLFRTVGLLTVMSPLSLQTQAAVFQDNSTNYIAFEAEKFDSLVRNQGENDGFNVVTINEFVSEFGSNILPATGEFSASGNSALLADMRYKHAQQLSTVEYKTVFNTPGSYRLYYRRSMFENGPGASYGGEDSFYYSKTFGVDPNKIHSTRGDQNGVNGSGSHPETNPSEGKFFWYNTQHSFVVTEDDVGKVLSFKISDRERGLAIDRFVFSLDTKLDVKEAGNDGDGNDLDQLANSDSVANHVFSMDFVPHNESDSEVAARETELNALHTDYLSYVEQQNASGNGSMVIDELISKINKQNDVNSALRTLITLTTAYYPQWHNEVTARFREEGEKARLYAKQVIEDSDGKINDLKQVIPITRYMDYAWGLYIFDEFHGDSSEAVAFRLEFEDFVSSYIEGTKPYYDNAYYTTGYNKEVSALDVASTISLLYKDSDKYPITKEAFSAFWLNVTQLSYDGDNSPHYDGGTGFHTILNMALRHGLESDVIASEHLLRMADRMARTVMSSGQSAKWGKSAEKSRYGQIMLTAGGGLPWNLKLAYRLWNNPYYLYVARKYEAFYLKPHASFVAKEYVPDLWPIGINAHDISQAKPSQEDKTTRATPRITSCCAYNGMLLGRGDTNYVNVQDKLIVSTGHHPRAPYLFMDLSYSQHKGAEDHRTGIDAHNFNGAHTVTRKNRWFESNKNNSVYINPVEFDYPSAPYPSKQLGAPGNINIFKEVMGYNPAVDYVVDSYGAENISEDAAYGFVDYKKYQYSGVGVKRQVVQLHNGIAVVSDTISTEQTYLGGHEGGALYQVLHELKAASGDNWVLLQGQQKMLPTELSTDEKESVDTLVMFASVPEGVSISLVKNPDDPENREWLSAYKTLKVDDTFTLISLIVPLARTEDIEVFTSGVEVESHNDTDSTVRIPYSRQQQLQVTFNDLLRPSFEYVDIE